MLVSRAIALHRPTAPVLIPIGHSKYYELIGSGQLRSVKVGRRRFVTEQAVADYIAA
ncbi:ethanolamine utilization protein EutA, partial [Nocardia cyriacigeorgica]|nr:ethanolamine utilization protein EutA [Nocardia cyriacigeorgica]